MSFVQDVYTNNNCCKNTFYETCENVVESFKTGEIERTLTPLQKNLVTIYENSTQFSDFFEVPISSAKTKLVYKDILPSIDSKSFFVLLENARGKIESTSFKPGQNNPSQLLHHKIGKKITIHDHFCRSYSGTLLTYSDKGYTLLVSEEDGRVMTLRAEDVSYIDVGEIEEAKLEATYISSNFPETITGQISYFAQALIWEAGYRLVLEETEEKLTGQWFSEAQITNLTDKSFKDLTACVVSGKLNEQQPIPSYKMMSTMCAAESMNGAPQVKNWGGLKAFPLAQKIDLAAKEMIFAKLYEPTSVSVIKTYELKSSEYDSGFKRPMVCYNIPNNVDEGLNQPLPKGRVQIYQKEGNALNYLGAPVIDRSPQGETVKVYAHESFDLGVKRSTHMEEVRNAIGKVIAQKVYVSFELSNQSDQDQVICLKEHLPHNAKLVSDAQIGNSKEIVFDVKVPKNTSTESPLHFQYEYVKQS